MGYVLGIDCGTTFTAAAIGDPSSETAKMLGLGNRAEQVPSVLYRQPDGTFLIGEPAERRGQDDPSHVVREFKRRIGDGVPILVSGAPYSPQALTGHLLRWVFQEATERLGRPPDRVVLTHPANWTRFKIDLFRQAGQLADLGNVTMCTEPEAAARQYAEEHPIATGDRICVYDLGGGTFDAAVLQKTSDGFTVLGVPTGIEHLGGIDFDEAVFRRVLDEIAPADQDLGGPARFVALARLRRECVDAKEALSSDVDAQVAGSLVGRDFSVRLTRAEFEDMIKPALRDTIAATDRALRGAGTSAGDLAAFVLVGGSSKIPLVTENLVSTYHRPVVRTVHPKHDVALGSVGVVGMVKVVAAVGTAISSDTIAATNPKAVRTTERPEAAPIQPESAVRTTSLALPLIPVPPPPLNDVHGLVGVRSDLAVVRTPDEAPSNGTGLAGPRSPKGRRPAVLAAATGVAVLALAGVLFVLQGPRSPAVPTDLAVVSSPVTSYASTQPESSSPATVLATANSPAAAPTAAAPTSSPTRAPPGTLWAWGSYRTSQGNGTNLDSALPLRVSGLTGVASVVGGPSGGYALLRDATVWAWGGNEHGRLGNGTTGASAVPVQVSGLANVTAIAALDATGYAVLEDGTAWAWGEGFFGQLGNGAKDDSSVPVQVTDLTGVTAVAASRFAGYALLRDGTVWAWGSGDSGELGNGATDDSSVPVQVSDLTGVTAITSHPGTAFALLADGTVWGWGFGGGHLGNGATDNSSVPVQVVGLSAVGAISDRYALLNDGTVMAWGEGERGELGNATNADSLVPVPVFGLTGVTAIAGGGSNGYALLGDGTVWAWGRGVGGQLGNGARTDSWVPVPVSGLSGIAGIGAGQNTGFAVN